MKAILNWLTGWCTVSVPPDNAVDALNRLKDSGCAHWHMRTEETGSIRFRMLRRDAAVYLSGWSGACVSEVRGLPALFERYRGRIGIPLGALLFALILWRAGNVVWDVTVSGNKRLSDTEIVGMLSDFGFGVGTEFRDIDFDVLQNDFLLTTEGISWIAVNMEGTVARVEVRESQGREEKPVPGTAANVVAAEDGQILEVRLSGGKAAVSRGDTVRRGDLLITGILTVREDGLRFEYGSGEVLAQVHRVISVESPLQRTETVPTGAEKCRKSISFFDKEVKLFRNTGIDYAKYDTIIENKQLTLPGGLTLPVWITSETVRELREETVTVTEERAYADALMLHRTEMDVLLRDAEVLSMETSYSFANGVCRIVTHAVCAADIARTAEIAVG